MQIRPLVSVLLLLSLVTVVFFFDISKWLFSGNYVTHGTKICLDGKACKDKAELKVVFEQFPVLVEEEIKAKLSLKPGWKLKRGWVEGVNMYMGKTQVIIEQQADNHEDFEILFFLGSCSEPKMHWRLSTEWKNESSIVKNSQTVAISYDFYTSR